MNYKDCAELLKRHDGYLVITHKNPDGDTTGSAAALCAALRRIGKTAYAYPNPGMNGKLLPYIAEYYAPEGFSAQFIIAVDIAAESLFPRGFEGAVDLCVDHHPTNSHYAKNSLIVADRASCGEIMLELIKALRGPVTKAEATLLYLAVSTDTGCFRYSNTNSATFRAASELARLGADMPSVNFSFFRKASPARLKLEGMIYSSLRYYRDGKITVACVTLDMLSASGAGDDDLDDIANLAGRPEDSVLGITIREQPGGTCRLSLRSSPEVDCSAICAVFGGGGHALAAGCTISGTPERAREMILDVVNEVWK